MTLVNYSLDTINNTHLTISGYPGNQKATENKKKNPQRKDIQIMADPN
jgi:hypothetical protein